MRHIFKANKISNKNIQYSKDYLYTSLFTQLAKKTFLQESSFSMKTVRCNIHALRLTVSATQIDAFQRRRRKNREKALKV